VATGSGNAVTTTTTAVMTSFPPPPQYQPRHHYEQQERQRLYHQQQLSVRSENVAMTSLDTTGSRSLRRLSASETMLPAAVAKGTGTASAGARSVSSRLHSSNNGSYGGLLDISR
jgi:hypothetical protein